MGGPSTVHPCQYGARNVVIAVLGDKCVNRALCSRHAMTLAQAVLAHNAGRAIELAPWLAL